MNNLTISSEYLVVDELFKIISTSEAGTISLFKGFYKIDNMLNRMAKRYLVDKSINENELRIEITKLINSYLTSKTVSKKIQEFSKSLKQDNDALVEWDRASIMFNSIPHIHGSTLTDSNDRYIRAGAVNDTIAKALKNGMRVKAIFDHKWDGSCLAVLKRDGKIYPLNKVGYRLDVPNDLVRLHNVDFVDFCERNDIFEKILDDDQYAVVEWIGSNHTLDYDRNIVKNSDYDNLVIHDIIDYYGKTSIGRVNVEKRLHAFSPKYLKNGIHLFRTRIGQEIPSISAFTRDVHFNYLRDKFDYLEDIISSASSYLCISNINRQLLKIYEGYILRLEFWNGETLDNSMILKYVNEGFDPDVRSIGKPQITIKNLNTILQVDVENEIGRFMKVHEGTSYNATRKLICDTLLDTYIEEVEHRHKEQSE